MEEENRKKIKQLIHQKSFDEALELAKKTYPESEKDGFLIVKSFVEIKQKNVDKALDYGLEAYSFKPSAKAAYNLAYVYGRRRNRKKMKEWLHKTIEIEPGFEKSYYLIIWLYVSPFKHGKLVRYVKKGLNSNKSSKPLRSLLFYLRARRVFEYSLLSIIASLLLLSFSTDFSPFGLLGGGLLALTLFSYFLILPTFVFSYLRMRIDAKSL